MHIKLQVADNMSQLPAEPEFQQAYKGWSLFSRTPLTELC